MKLTEVLLEYFKINLLVVLFTFLLSGCYLSLAVENHNYTWYRSSNLELPMQVIQADHWFVVDLCDASVNIIACAQRLPAENICKVYTSYPELPQWVLDHEKRHCDGWSHYETSRP